MIYLTSENYAKFYNAKPFSFASILCLIIALATVVIPALLAFTTSGVGLRQTVYTEQPIITFRDELIIYNFQGSEVLGYSSSTTFNNGLGTSLITSPVIKALSIDSNHDGKADSFRFKISFNSDSQNLRLSQIYLFFTYELEERTRITMEDFVKIELNSASGIEKAKVIGRIELNQKKSLGPNTETANNYNQTIFDEPAKNLNIFDYEVAKQQRDMSISCNCESLVLPAWGSGSTEIDIELIVPEKQIIHYVSNTLETLKFSWIEFFSVFLPIFIIISFGMNFFFKNRFISVRETNNLGK